jgi:hypothetical protein
MPGSDTQGLVNVAVHGMVCLQDTTLQAYSTQLCLGCSVEAAACPGLEPLLALLQSKHGVTPFPAHGHTFPCASPCWHGLACSSDAAVRHGTLLGLMCGCVGEKDCNARPHGAPFPGALC